MCGDIAYIITKIRNRHAVGWYYHSGETGTAPDRALAAATRPELAFPNHDTDIMQGKRVTKIV